MEITPRLLGLDEIGRTRDAETAVRKLQREAAWAEVQRRIDRIKQHGPVNGYDIGQLADILEPVTKLDRDHF